MIWNDEDVIREDKVRNIRKAGEYLVKNAETIVGNEDNCEIVITINVKDDLGCQDIDIRKRFDI